MRKIAFTLFISSLIFIACQSDQQTNTSVETKNVNQNIAKAFSKLEQLDTFSIELIGTKPQEMKLIFTIKDPDGKEIYNTTLNGKELVENTDPNLNLSKEKAQITFLKTIADDFFAEDNFLEPAVMPEDKADQFVPDKTLYEELKKSGLNGFKYRLSKDKNIYIAWSEKEQKVKIYYSCC